jgi:hypothetical protein
VRMGRIDRGGGRGPPKTDPPGPVTAHLVAHCPGTTARTVPDFTLCAPKARRAQRAEQDVPLAPPTWAQRPGCGVRRPTGPGTGGTARVNNKK